MNNRTQQPPPNQGRTEQSPPPDPMHQPRTQYRQNSAASSERVRAAICALIPGIGAVYNRQYTKAVTHFAVFAGLAMLADAAGIFGLAAFSFYVFTIIDAYRSAELSRASAVSARNAEEGEINMPLWGGILVLMGILFLLDSLGAIYLRSMMQFWPLILIFLGGYLIYQHVTQKESDKGPRTMPPGAPAPSETPGEGLSGRPSEPSEAESSDEPRDHQERT